MKKILILITLITNGLLLFSQNNDFLNCYTIIAGKDASFDGSVLVGHNEDDYGDMLVNWYKEPKKICGKTDSITLLNGKKIKQSHKTNKYLRFQVTDQKFGDTYVNRYSLIICSNQSSSKEDTAKGNIGYYFRRIIAERSESSKDAVTLAGRLVQELGYDSYGRTYTFADKNEAWVFSVIGGKHWLAKRVPDDHVAVIPNYFTIQDVDINDTLNVLCSSGLLDYAEQRGWYEKNSSKHFNFRDIFGEPEVNNADYNIPRHITGINYFSEKQYEENDTLPFSFIPKSKVTLQDIKNILSNHYENSQYHSPPASLNVHGNIVHPICSPTTQFSFIAQLRPDMPFQIGILIWIAPYNGCIFPYIPIYFGASELNRDLCLNDSLKSDVIHFNKESNQIELFPEHAYYLFGKYTEYIEGDYPGRIKECQIKKAHTEKILKENQFKFEKSVLQVFEAYPNDAIRLLTEYTNRNITDLINNTKKQLNTKK